jgi:hypothetical protein
MPQADDTPAPGDGVAPANGAGAGNNSRPIPWGTLISLVVGVGLLVLFPFNGLLKLVSMPSVSDYFLNSRFCYFLALAVHSHGNECTSNTGITRLLSDHRWWEIIAFWWTIVFTLILIMLELPQQYAALYEGNSTTDKAAQKFLPGWSARVSSCVTASLALSICVYINGVASIVEAGYRSALAAKVLLALTFVTVNFCIIRRARRLALTEITEEFRRLNYNIDMPTLFALFLLMLWDRYFAEQTIGNLSEFISGASSVVLITTSFLFGGNIIADRISAHKDRASRHPTARA